MEDKKEARDKFRRADQLFREKNFAEALVVLDELETQFPDTRNIIYPRAMCLARVGRYDEALELCRQLKVEFGDERGDKLMAKIGERRRAEIEEAKRKQEVKTTGHAVPPPNVFTLDSNPLSLEERLEGKNINFSPAFNSNAVGSGAPPESSAGLAEGDSDVFDLGDGSPVIDMADFDNIFAVRSAPVPPPVKISSPPRTGLYIGIGIAVVAIVILLALLLLS